MIGRLLRGALGMMVYFCVATVIAEGIIVTWLSSTWHLDRDKLLQMVAIAQGIDLSALKPGAAPPHEERSPEQPSYEQVLEARAVKVRDLELREQALRSGLDQLHFAEGRLGDEKLAFQHEREAFETRLAGVEKQATEAGWEQNRQALLSAKPKQAKDLLLQMLEKNEMEAVVALVTPMTDSRRAKIFAEFKGEELKKVDEILRLIRRGDPLSGVTAATRQQLGPAVNSSPTQGTP